MSKDRKKEIKVALKMVGIKVPSNATLPQLEKLYKKHIEDGEPEKTKKKSQKKTVKKTKKEPNGNTPKRNRNEPVTKATQKEVEITTDIENVRKKTEFIQFLEYMATPRTLRQEVFGADTLEEYGKKSGVNKWTLVQWKKLPGFWNDVTRIRQAFFRDRSGDVLLSLETKCLNPQTVSGNDVRVYLTAIGEYVEKREEEHVIDPEVAKALDKVARTLPD